MANTANAVLRHLVFESERIFCSPHPGGYFACGEKLGEMVIEKLVRCESTGEFEEITNRRIAAARRRASIGQQPRCGL